MNLVSILLWIPAILVRWALILIGLVVVPLSLLGAGRDETPKIWRLWADVEQIPTWWRHDVGSPPKWSYAYVPLLLLAAFYSYHHWHPLIFFALFLAALSTSYVATDSNRWSSFWWMAVRNPTLGLAGLVKQPILEPRPNPDQRVRNNGERGASRWLRDGLFSEYWYLRKVGKKYFEFRIGWKFVDGNDEFFPTVQFRVGE